MNIPFPSAVLVSVILVGGIIAVCAFLWAVRHKQLRDFNAGAYVIFDKDEPVGKMTETTFGDIEENNNTSGERQS